MKVQRIIEEWICPKCRIKEKVTDYTSEIMHKHNGTYYLLEFTYFGKRVRKVK